MKRHKRLGKPSEMRQRFLEGQRQGEGGTALSARAGKASIATNSLPC